MIFHTLSDLANAVLEAYKDGKNKSRERRFSMPRKKMNDNERIQVIRRACHLHEGDGLSIAETGRLVGFDERSIYRWKAKSIIWRETAQQIKGESDG